MKKFLTVLVALFMVVSIFAAVEKPFTLGPVSYTGKVSFSLVADKDGVNFSGSFPTLSASLAFTPTSDTQAGATFDFVYTPFGGVTLSLQSITFSTPYFGTYYSVDKQFVSDYFTGKNYKANPVTWTDTFGAHFADSLKLTFPVVQGLELYMLDRTAEATNVWFEDMLLAKYKYGDWTFVGGLYGARTTTEATSVYEYGVEAKGSIGLGVATPTVTVFVGNVATDTSNATTTMTLAYDVQVGATLEPVKGLTLAPAFKYAENLEKLDYRSSNIENAKYAQLGVTYTAEINPATVTVNVTPRYDFDKSFADKLNDKLTGLRQSWLTRLAQGVGTEGDETVLYLSEGGIWFAETGFDITDISSDPNKDVALKKGSGLFFVRQLYKFSKMTLDEIENVKLAKSITDPSTSTGVLIVPLNKLSVTAGISNVELYVDLWEPNVIDEEWSLIATTKLSYDDKKMISASVEAKWFYYSCGNYSDMFALYIQANGSVKPVDKFTITAKVRTLPGFAEAIQGLKEEDLLSDEDVKKLPTTGYNIGATYEFTDNVKLSGSYGTLTDKIYKDPTWNLKLTYEAKF